MGVHGRVNAGLPARMELRAPRGTRARREPLVQLDARAHLVPRAHLERWDFQAHRE